MIVNPDDDGQRLDRFLKKNFPTLTFGQLQKLIRTGQIRINGSRAKTDSRLSLGDDLRLPPSLQNQDHHTNKPKFNHRDRSAIEDMIIFEDDHILILNKPNGLAVQGGSKTKIHIDGMMDSYIKKGVKPRLCHRLDRDTSGVLVLGKTADATRILTKQFQNHDITKTYWALTTPAPIDDSGIINAKIGKANAHKNGGEVMIHDPENGQKGRVVREIRAARPAARSPPGPAV